MIMCGVLIFIWSGESSIFGTLSFGGLTNLTVSEMKILFSIRRSFCYHVQCLFPIVLSGSQDPVRFVKPMARQNSGKYTLRMTVKVANTPT